MDQSVLTHDLAALAQVVLIDVTLAGDNAVVVGMAVAGLPAQHRRTAIFLGIAGATIIRIALGAVALQLLEIIGLSLAGGLLLLWVCWRMFRELRGARHHAAGEQPQKTLTQAMMQIILADLSMSLDNVLAVAGAASGSTWVLATGLLLSVVLVGVAANLLASALERHRWIAWFGLLVVLYVSISMIWHGSHEVARAVVAG
jgi:YjbE family integral membrane protein